MREGVGSRVFRRGLGITKGDSTWSSDPEILLGG